MRNETIPVMPQQLLKNMSREQFMVLDVRTCHEFIGGHVAGAVNIPYDRLDFFIEEIMTWNKPIIVVSAGGRRSHIAARFLTNRGLEAIDGGDWEEIHQLLD
ncbi:MAG: rhodanese-like domain-containing protein [Bacteroidota bacterium]